jgi:hypothetical protein
VYFKIYSGVMERHAWHIRMCHNGDRFFRGTRIGAGDNSHVLVRRRVRDRDGTDRFVTRGFDTSTGEVCRVHAKI